MKKYTFLVLLLCLAALSLLTPQKAFAGAWTLPKHNLWTEFFVKYAFANEHYDNHWDREPLGWDPANGVNKGAEWWTVDYELKAEYGLSDWLNALFAIAYSDAQYKEYNRPAGWGPYTVKSQDWKYVNVGLKARATQQPMVVSYQIKGSFANSGAKGDNPSIGKNDDSVELRLLVGKSYKLGRLPAYSGFETGYRWRQFDEVANDVPIFFETGIVLLDWLMITGELDTWLACDNTGEDRESMGTIRGGIIISPSGQFNQFRKSKSNFNVAIQGGYTVFGENTNAGWEVIVKVSSQFDIPSFTESIEKQNHPNTKEVVTPTNAAQKGITL